jgi:hypothetical protein
MAMLETNPHETNSKFSPARNMRSSHATVQSMCTMHTLAFQQLQTLLTMDDTFLFAFSDAATVVP